MKNMPLHKQVTSVEISNKIHQLGVVVPSLFYREWTGAKETEIERWDIEDGDYCEDNVNCYTVAELGEILPDGTETDKDSSNLNYEQKKKWRCIELITTGGENQYADTEADARGKMLIYLLENKLITL